MITKDSLKQVLIANNSEVGGFINAPCYVYDKGEGVIAKMIGIIIHDGELYSIISYERAGSNVQTIVTELNLELFSIKDLKYMEDNVNDLFNYGIRGCFSDYDVSVIEKFLKA